MRGAHTIVAFALTFCFYLSFLNKTKNNFQRSITYFLLFVIGITSVD